MKLSEFLRVYPLRAKNLMWLLGAGASAGARVPSATDLMWLFKRTIYATEQKVSPKLLTDLSDENVRRRIQGYLDATRKFPKAGEPDEYAALFEYTYPDAKDRRTKLDALLSGAQPSYGHSVLGALMRLGLVRIVWTTNFDRVVEDAAHRAFGGSSAVTVASIDSAAIAVRALNEGSFPLVVKLHGDFHSERLKNTTSELRDQDAQLRRALNEACRRFGLLVVGYSGRDQSVMDVLEAASKEQGAFPGGLFWMVRSDGLVFDRVSQLIDGARARGIDAHIVEVETFDELLGDLFTQIPDVPDDIAATVQKRIDRLSFATMPSDAGTYPMVRLNALPISSLPTVCRLIECDIGGQKEVQKAIVSSGAKVIAGRRNVGVLAFGSDAAVREAFGTYNIRGFDIHQIEQRRLAYESIEFGMVSAALARALARSVGMREYRRRPGYRLAPLSDADPKFAQIKRVMSLTGAVPGTSTRCRPVLDVRLDIRFDRPWLLMEPSISIDDPVADSDREKGRDYVREQRAKIYNRNHSALLDAWIDLLFGGSDDLKTSALGIADGLDASFTISRVSAFSRRSQ